MKEVTAHSGPRPGVVPRRAFTLVELMVVVAILALLFMLLAPSLQSAVERVRISNCGSVLHHIGNAVQQYVAENHGYMCPCAFRSDLSYKVLSQPPFSGVDRYGNPWSLNYGCGYTYHNLIAPYLGLGNCMPVEKNDSDSWNQWNRWAKASYSMVKEYQCPSGLKQKSPYGWACDPANGGSTSGFYMQNVCWTSQPQITGAEWPSRMAYFPRFRDTSVAILIYEYWSCNGMTGDGDAAAQPYTTHFRRSNRAGSALGIGRNMLYADFHMKFVPSGDAPDTAMTLPWYNATIIRRGNEMGIYFKSAYDGRQYIEWCPLRDGQDSKGAVVGLLERG